MKDGVNATPLPTVNTTGYIDHAAFLGTINPDTNKIPKHLFQGYLNIYNNYFKAPWMPDRTEANHNELNQDDDFFFSSRRRHTRFSRDWSSDVCSSDLTALVLSQATGIIRDGGCNLALGVADRQPLAAKNRRRRSACVGRLSVAQCRWGTSKGQIGRASCRERG